jgi:cell wall-associated NlpC family hydrolase
MQGVKRPVLARLFAAGVFVIGLPVLARAQVAPADTIPADSAKPFAAFSQSALSLGDSIVAMARRQIGKRYVIGGKSPSRGFDCSGLVQYVAAALHIALPRTAREQAHVGAALPRDTSDMRPGDLVTFGRGNAGVSHIGIYAGNGRFIHASVAAGRIIETNLLRPWAAGKKRWRGVRRLVVSDSSALARSDSSN